MPPKASKQECAKVYVVSKDDQQIEFGGKAPENLLDTVRLVPLTDFAPGVSQDISNMDLESKIKVMFTVRAVGKVPLDCQLLDKKSHFEKPGLVISELDVGSEDDEDSETDLKLAQTKTLRSKDKKVVGLLKKDEETKINLAKIVHAENSTMNLSSSMDKLSMVPDTIYQIGNSTEKTKQQVDKLAMEAYKSFNSFDQNFEKINNKLNEIEQKVEECLEKNKSSLASNISASSETPKIAQKPKMKKPLFIDSDSDKDLFIVETNQSESLKRTHSKSDYTKDSDDDNMLPELSSSIAKETSKVKKYKNESHLDDLDDLDEDDDEDESVGDASCFKPPFNAIRFPDHVYDQADLNSFLFKRLDNLLVSKHKGVNDADLLKIRFKNFRNLKKQEAAIINQVTKEFNEKLSKAQAKSKLCWDNALAHRRSTLDNARKRFKEKQGSSTSSIKITKLAK